VKFTLYAGHIYGPSTPHSHPLFTRLSGLIGTAFALHTGTKGERTMNRLLSSTLLAGALFAGAFVVGCDDTKSHTTETKVKDDGTVVKKEDKVTQNPDGTVTHTEKKSVDKPDKDGDATIKVDVDKK
jgi:hypothetical protein